MTLTHNNYCSTLEQSANLFGVSPDRVKLSARENIRSSAALISQIAANKNNSKNPIDLFDTVKHFLLV